jgi:hypothetical protein
VLLGCLQDIGDIVIGSVLGNSSQRAIQCRMASLLAGIPETVAVHTVNRYPLILPICCLMDFLVSPRLFRQAPASVQADSTVRIEKINCTYPVRGLGVCRDHLADLVCPFISISAQPPPRKICSQHPMQF